MDCCLAFTLAQFFLKPIQRNRLSLRIIRRRYGHLVVQGDEHPFSVLLYVYMGGVEYPARAHGLVNVTAEARLLCARWFCRYIAVARKSLAYSAQENHPSAANRR